MTPQEVARFIEHLQHTYQRFNITATMIDYWARELVTVPVNDAMLAVRRYIVSGAREDEPPRLQTLLNLLDGIKAERRREAQRQTQDASVAEILAEAQARARGKDHDWARGHYEMFLRGVARRPPDAVAFCQEMARRYPADAQDWLAEAALYGPEGPWGGRHGENAR